MSNVARSLSLVEPVLAATTTQMTSGTGRSTVARVKVLLLGPVELVVEGDAIELPSGREEPFYE